MTSTALADRGDIISHARAASISHARAAMARAPAGLAAAARLLPVVARERAWMLHAWWRVCAETRDGDGAAPLDRIRRLTARALAGQSTNEPGFDALGIVAAECGLSWAQIADVIAGFEIDRRPDDNDTELLIRAYYAAGAIAVLMARAMGIAEDDGELLDCACDCGVALWLGRLACGFGKPDRRRLHALAAPYRRSARYGAAHLPFRCRWAACSLLVSGWREWRWLAGLVLALQHGPDDAQVPVPRAVLAGVMRGPERASPEDAAAETAAPSR